jgi:hypothetical protein
MIAQESPRNELTPAVRAGYDVSDRFVCPPDPARPVPSAVTGG